MNRSIQAILVACAIVTAGGVSYIAVNGLPEREAEFRPADGRTWDAPGGALDRHRASMCSLLEMPVLRDREGRVIDCLD